MLTTDLSPYTMYQKRGLSPAPLVLKDLPHGVSKKGSNCYENNTITATNNEIILYSVLKVSVEGKRRHKQAM